MKDINNQNYKDGWVDGYCEGQEETNYSSKLTPEQQQHYFYGFNDGILAYSKEIEKTIG